MFLSLLRQVILLIPLYLILPNYFGLNGVWFAGPIADGISAIITGTFLYREIKKLRDAHESNNTEDNSLIKEA
jgi:Na+-driven multidrug efflux pump